MCRLPGQDFTTLKESFSTEMEILDNVADFFQVFLSYLIYYLFPSKETNPESYVKVH